MTGKLSKNFHGVGIGPLSNILAVKSSASTYLCSFHDTDVRAYVRTHYAKVQKYEQSKIGLQFFDVVLIM